MHVPSRICAHEVEEIGMLSSSFFFVLLLPHFPYGINLAATLFFTWNMAVLDDVELGLH